MPGFRLFGGYEHIDKSFQRSELGVGGSLAPEAYPMMQFTADISINRWKRKVTTDLTDSSDANYSATASESYSLTFRRLALGVQGQPIPELDFWANVGPLWLSKDKDRAKLDPLDFKSTVAWRLGLQYMLTPTLGLVAEGDFMNASQSPRFYKFGIRANF